MAELNDSNFLERANLLLLKIERGKMTALGTIADELLRLSQREVPLDKGTLMGSGVSFPNGDEYIVGYNMVYAAKMHEHPEFHFQNNRKGKYLEDPMKLNKDIFINFFNTKMKEVMMGGI